MNNPTIIDIIENISGKNKHVKIAILTPTFNYHSGIDRVVQQQAQDLLKKGHKVTVVALEAKIKPSKIKQNNPENHAHHPVSSLMLLQ